MWPFRKSKVEPVGENTLGKLVRANSAARAGIVSKRSAGPIPMANPYEIVANSPHLPQVSDIGPYDTARYQWLMTKLSRHLYRTDVWTRRIVSIMCDLVVGDQVEPICAIKPLNDLFRAHARHIDSRGVHGFTGWLRSDVFKPYIVDSEVLLRRIPVSDEEMELFDIWLPVQWQSLETDFIPNWQVISASGGNPVVMGIEFWKNPRTGQQTERRVAYHLYEQHPRNVGYGIANTMKVIRVDAREVCHLFEPGRPGSPRGENLFASSLGRAAKLGTFEDAELRRKNTASAFTNFLERPIESDEMDDFPNEEAIDEFMSQVVIEPGGLIRLPVGMKVTSSAPPDTPANFIPYVAYQIMAMSSVAGLPRHQITGDYENVSDRSAKFAGLDTQRRVRIERTKIKEQVLDSIWRAHVDACIAVGAWTPRSDAELAAAYVCDWRWPAVQIAALNQELGTVMEAVQKGIVSRPWVAQTYFGVDAANVDRENADAGARATELGLAYGPEAFQASTPLAERVSASVQADEAAERDIVDRIAGR